ncbi:hypothetical protein C8R43DRAFT_1205742 [Mycena crocata]|nr:hypothetical protein C8R43DRAFT_1205742 [Mycena crocata]
MPPPSALGTLPSIKSRFNVCLGRYTPSILLPPLQKDGNSRFSSSPPAFSFLPSPFPVFRISPGAKFDLRQHRSPPTPDLLRARTSANPSRSMPGPALAYGPEHYSAADVVEYVELTLVGNYVLYTTATILVYELFTSLDDEVARVWSLKWRLPKILFMLNRYVIRAMLVALWILSDFPGTSAEFCRIYSYWQMAPLRLAILAAQALVVIRVWAIYNNSRRMFWVLGGLYAMELAAVVTCVVGATMDTQGVAQPAPLSCGLNSMSGHLLKEYASGTWIAPVCFEFIMLIITLAKLAPRWTWAWRDPPRSPTSPSENGPSRRGTGVLGRLGSGGNITLDVLARDSLIYFGFIFSFTLTNAVIYSISFSSHYHAILLGPTSAISCIAVSRMMINIRSLPTSPHMQHDADHNHDYHNGADLSFADTYDGWDSTGAEAGSAGAKVYTAKIKYQPGPGKGGDAEGGYTNLPGTAWTAYFDTFSSHFPAHFKTASSPAHSYSSAAANGSSPSSASNKYSHPFTSSYSPPDDLHTDLHTSVDYSSFHTHPDYPSEMYGRPSPASARTGRWGLRWGCGRGVWGSMDSGEGSHGRGGTVQPFCIGLRAEIFRGGSGGGRHGHRHTTDMRKSITVTSKTASGAGDEAIVRRGVFV